VLKHITAHDRFVRTQMGDEEIFDPILRFAPSARNLLLVIDPNFSGFEWMEKIRDCTKDDLLFLVEQNLVERVVEPVSAQAVEHADERMAST
jgi:hypothetical protein